MIIINIIHKVLGINCVNFSFRNKIVVNGAVHKFVKKKKKEVVIILVLSFLMQHQF